jgi:hypothetical protein
MGVHEAYHLARPNRVVHWIAIPIELAAAAKLLSLAKIGPIDLALVAIVVLGAIYLATDLLGGALMIGLLVGLWAMVLSIGSGSIAIDAAVSVAVFVVASRSSSRSAIDLRCARKSNGTATKRSRASARIAFTPRTTPATLIGAPEIRGIAERTFDVRRGTKGAYLCLHEAIRLFFRPFPPRDGCRKHRLRGVFR